jgi:single-strand DNA-binding protein
MADVNKVFLIGRLTQDPELRYTPNGAPVTDLRLAVNRITGGGEEGERREEVLFVDVTVWNRQAETCCQYLNKGRAVHVEGFLRMDTWDDRTTGEKRSKIKVVAERVQFLDGGRRDENGTATRDEEFTPRASAAPRPAPAAPRPAPAAPPRRPTPAPSADPEADVEDDIPF